MEQRFVFVKDPERTLTGFKSLELANEAFAKSGLVKDGPTERTRIRYRSRTNTWDIVVKVRREVKS